MPERLPPGKVPWDLIRRHLGSTLPDNVVLGPAQGEDAALVDIGGQTWAVASDPISFPATNPGRLAVLVNANDVAVRGARPTLFTAVVMVAPREASREDVGSLLEDVERACAEIGVALIGGHTEVTPGLSHTMVVGTMLGPVEGRPITTSGLREGDWVGLVGQAALEASSILLADYRDGLRAVVDEGLLDDVRAATDGDYLLVVEPALAAARCEGVHALHDVTEGGVGEALHELERASGLRIDVPRSRVPVLAGTRAIADALGFDPMGAIGSGALLVGCSAEARETVETSLGATGRRVTWLAQARRDDRSARPDDAVPRFERDEILRAFRLAGIEGFIFDMDGTLVDSAYDWEAIRERLGVTGGSIIDELNGRDPEASEAGWAIMHEIENRASDEAKGMPGATELLTFLDEIEAPRALVTNNTDTNAARLMKRFGLRLDHIVTRDSGAWKPSARPVSEAVRRLGLSPERCVMVGDSEHDLTAGRDAGCGAVVIVGPHAPRYADRADLTFDTLEGFLRYLRIVS